MEFKMVVLDIIFPTGVGFWCIITMIQTAG
jgi:hypothetical protein